jgi:hypothetical protein
MEWKRVPNKHFQRVCFHTALIGLDDRFNVLHVARIIRTILGQRLPDPHNRVNTARRQNRSSWMALQKKRKIKRKKICVVEPSINAVPAQRLHKLMRP